MSELQGDPRVAQLSARVAIKMMKDEKTSEGLIAQHGSIEAARAAFAATTEARHGEDVLSSIEEIISGMPAEDGTLDTDIARDMHTRTYKMVAIDNSFPNFRPYDDDCSMSGAIKSKGWYDHQEKHPAMDNGKVCFEASSKMPILCKTITSEWEAGKRHNGRMIPTIITVYRTPLIFPLLAALRFYFEGSDIPANIEAVYPDGIHQIGRFRRGEIDILILPIQLGLVSDLKFCKKMIHFEVIPDMEARKQVEALAFDKSEKVSVQTMTEWFTPLDKLLIEKLGEGGYGEERAKVSGHFCKSMDEVNEILKKYNIKRA